MSRKAPIHIGTSGWNYRHWKGPFYPDDCPQSKWLEHYAGRFSSVEINGSFYRLPETRTLRNWKESTPDQFCFTAKASRYLTHMKKLKDPKAPLRQFVRRMGVLRPKLGPLLFQLPPRWRLDLDRLRAFLQALPEDHRCAFEFRDESWFCEEVYESLAQRNAALCVYDLSGFTSPREVTADFVYVRLHGPKHQAYQGEYGPRGLAGWAGAVSTWSRQGTEVFCYFDNDQAAYAVKDAHRLEEMIEAQ